MMPDSLSFTRIDETSLLLDGEISHQTASDAISKLTESIGNYSGKNLTIDLSELSSVNSTVLSVLLTGLRVAKKKSCKLQYNNLSERLFNMARVGGVESILTNVDL